MKFIISVLLVLTSYVSIGQVYNSIPQYVFKNRLGVGRSTQVDSSAYMNIGPNGAGVAGILPPRISDTLAILGTKRHGLLIFSRQLDNYAWWDSTGSVWTQMGQGGSSALDAVVIQNGSSTVGDTILVSNTGGDTARIKNILLGEGLLMEKLGDTVLKIVVDSSIVPNFYNRDGAFIDDRVALIPDNQSLVIQGGTTPMTFIGASTGVSAGVIVYDQGLGSSTGAYFKVGQGSSIDSTGEVRMVSTNNHMGHVDGSGVLVDRKGVQYAGVQRREWKDSLGYVNVYLTSSCGFLRLGDLTARGASRTVDWYDHSLDDEIVIMNRSSDATYKWTFAKTVKDQSGTTVTAIDDLTTYHLIYLTGNGWTIINKY